jgi:hypothetical protein
MIRETTETFGIITQDDVIQGNHPSAPASNQFN